MYWKGVAEIVDVDATITVMTIWALITMMALRIDLCPAVRYIWKFLGSKGSGNRGVSRQNIGAAAPR